MKTENLYTPDCIRTVSGIYVNVFNPKPEMFELSDIAWALSRMERFTAHLPTSYTVLQHCLYVSFAVSPKNKLAALLHEAFEAYGHDLAGPIKRRIPQYKNIEDNVMRVIADKFGFEYPLCEEVKQVDNAILEYEWEQIMLGGADWSVKKKDVRAMWQQQVGLFLFERDGFVE